MTPQSQGSTTYVRLIAAIALSAVSAWAAVTYFNHGTPRPNASPRPRPQNYGLPPVLAPVPAAPIPSIRQEPSDQTTIAALPPLVSDNGPAMTWDGIQGLRVRPADTRPVVLGQQPLVLTQARIDGLHRLGIRIRGLKIGAHYRVTAWLKGASADRIALDGRDAANANSGIALFNLATSTVVKSSGKITGPSIALFSDGWAKASIDLQSSDGTLVVYVGQLNPDESISFRGDAASELTFGGIAVSEIP